MTDDIGRALDGGRYRLEGIIGDGGMGRVFSAVRTRVSSRVAIKKLSPEFSREPSIRQRFRAEAEYMAQLQHPNIVQAHDYLDEGGDLFIVMDFVEGESLEDHLARVGTLSLGEIWDILGPVSMAIQHAHGHGIVHRDLKPANIMLDTRSGQLTPKVLDFGIAKLLDESEDRHARHGHRTVIGSRLGTPGYMSPEQQADSARIDERTDVFALGVIAYRMALGRLPGDEKAPYTAPSSLRPHLGPGFDELIERSLAHDRNRRIASAEHFAAALHRLALEVDASARTGPHPPVPRPVSRAPHRHPTAPTVHEEPARPGPTSVVAGEAGEARADRSSPQSMRLAVAVIVLIGILALVLVSRRESTEEPTEAMATGSTKMGPDACDADAVCAPGQACRDGRCLGPPRGLPSGMVWVDGGHFGMGDGCMDNNSRHSVDLSGFAISAGVSSAEVSETHDWYAARRNCRGRGAGFDLPTEAQWAYAVNHKRIAPAGRAEWVRDWYHEDYFQWSEQSINPTGPTDEQCQKDPGSWATSKHRSEAERCCKVVRGNGYGPCDVTQARSFYGPSVAAKMRGFRCVWTP